MRSRGRPTPVALAHPGSGRGPTLLALALLLLLPGTAGGPADGAVTVPPHDGARDPGAPHRVVIPAIGVDAPLAGVGLRDDGAMEVPDFGTAGWYEPGPAPGQPGPGVVVGHVDSRVGPDVFHRLDRVGPGAQVRVVDGRGRVETFVVTDRELVDKGALPTDRIWTATDEPVLRLITCGGTFDEAAGGYDGNVIVYAERPH